MQTLGAMQPGPTRGSQVLLQALFMHRYPPHDCVLPVPAHMPSPSQVLVTTEELSPEQVCPHSTLAGACLH